MQLNNNLNIKHSQSIVMTPQLRQAIKLLQFSNLGIVKLHRGTNRKKSFSRKNKKSDIFSNTDSLKLSKSENNFNQEKRQRYTKMGG